MAPADPLSRTPFFPLSDLPPGIHGAIQECLSYPLHLGAAAKWLHALYGRGLINLHLTTRHTRVATTATPDPASLTSLATFLARQDPTLTGLYITRRELIPTAVLMMEDHHFFRHLKRLGVWVRGGSLVNGDLDPLARAMTAGCLPDLESLDLGGIGQKDELALVPLTRALASGACPRLVKLELPSQGNYQPGLTALAEALETRAALTHPSHSRP